MQRQEEKRTEKGEAGKPRKCQHQPAGKSQGGQGENWADSNSQPHSKRAQSPVLVGAGTWESHLPPCPWAWGNLVACLMRYSRWSQVTRCKGGPHCPPPPHIVATCGRSSAGSGPVPLPPHLWESPSPWVSVLLLGSLGSRHPHRYLSPKAHPQPAHPSPQEAVKLCQRFSASHARQAQPAVPLMSPVLALPF